VKKHLNDKAFEIDSEIEAGENQKSILKLSAHKLVEGAKFIVSGGFDPESKDPLVKTSWHVKGEGEYTRPNFSGSLAVTVGEDPGKERKERDSSNPGAHIVGSIVAGSKGLSLGGQLKTNVENVQNLVDVNFGVHYEKENLGTTFLTEENGEVLRASATYQKDSWQFGAEFVSDEFDKLSKPSDPHRRVLNLATEYQVDPNSILKGRISTTETAGLVFERRCSTSPVTFHFSSQWKLKGYSHARFDKFGAGITYDN